MKRLIARAEERVTRAHVLAVALALLPLTAAANALAIWADPALRWRLPLGHDFPAFWSAARLWWQGGIAAVYDLPAYEALQASVATRPGLLLWHYPPSFLLLILPLGLLPYAAAFWAFTLAGLAALLAALRGMLPDRLLWALALGAPVVAVNLNQGQNGLLTGAALVGALRAREAGRGWLAALLIAALMVKPQLAVLVPVALVASRDWRLIGQTALCSAGFALAATAVAGLDGWRLFLNNLPVLGFAMETGDLWPQSASLWAALRMAGIAASPAFALQAALALAAVALVWRTWRADLPGDLRLTLLLLASPMVSPYLFSYDLVPVLAAVLLLAARGLRDGFLEGERLCLALLWLLPGLSPALALATGVNIGVLIAPFGLWLVWRRRPLA